jgi:hypothetical protein
MKLIIAGGRDYALTDDDRQRLDDIHNRTPITEVVSGHATGADLGGEEWAEARGIPVRLFRARWGLHGPSAGPIRNGQMAKYADAVALFPGGRGTANMAQVAQKAGLQIFDFTGAEFAAPALPQEECV